MASTKASLAALYTAMLALWAAPALALAQAAQPGSAPAPVNDTTAGHAGGSGWLWIIAALIVLAIIWWAMSSRRRHGVATR